MSIRSKLTSAFIGLALMVLIVAYLALTALNNANDRFVQFVTGVNARAGMANQLRRAVDERAIAARNLVLVTKAADRDSEKAVVGKAHEKVGASLAKLKDMIAKATIAAPRAGELVEIGRAHV